MGKYKYCDKCDPESPTRANFNFPGKAPLRCKRHIEPGMVNVTIKKCEFTNEKGERCIIAASYNFPGKKGAKRCSLHHLDGMMHTGRKCIGIDKKTGKRCIKNPSYNYEGKAEIYCFDHAEEGMINVRKENYLCKKEECITRASFNYPGEKIGLFCEKDKLEGMINVISRRCDFLNCPKIPTYNFLGEKGGKSCSKHKKEGMIDVVNRNKICSECDTRASFGPLFGPKNHCVTHKSKNEFRHNNPICEEQNCNENAACTNDGTNYPRRCDDHKTPDDINIVEKPCKKCGLSFFLNEKSGLCDYCNDFFIKEVHKKKETEVINYLKQFFHFISTDKIPEGACTKYRPDGVIDFLHFLVIVEIDEHQHNSYPEKCEMSRMIQVQQDAGGIPVVFIRYNPDTYKNIKGETIKPNSKHRLDELCRVLKGMEILRDEYEIKNYNFPPLSVCYVFYDNYTEPKLEGINIDEVIKTL